MEFFQYRFNMPQASFGTPDSALHSIRRAAIVPFFNKRKVIGHGPYIQSVADRISYRLSTEYAGTDKVLDLVHMWGSMTSDVIAEIVFARPKNFIDKPDFKSDFTVSLNDMVYTAPLTTHFGWVLTIMNAFPNWLAKICFPGFKTVIEFREASSPSLIIGIETLHSKADLYL
jgi:hypothetical protein